MEPPRLNIKTMPYIKKDQHPLRLLSLDGGGVRGYSMILLLQELMLKIFVELEGRAPRIDEIPKPCDHFDLIGGTGTGGLIAIMIGRLRLDLETCKELYIRMTKRVFETDKTIAGLPFRKTLFKASKLEEAIKEAVQEATAMNMRDSAAGGGGGDYYSGVNRLRDNLMLNFKSPSAVTLEVRKRGTYGSLTDSSEGSRDSMKSRGGSGSHGGSRSASASTTKSSKGQWRGDEDAPLYDARDNRCKTFVTAVYKHSDECTSPALLRTYDSSQGTWPSQGCTVWEAGRATSATFPAFKQIQIGQNIFLDEGYGRFSPVAQVLEEAIVHEWPGREVGVLVSIGSGKRPPGRDGDHHYRQTQTNKHPSKLISASPLGKLVQAKEKHSAKVEDCEAIHKELVNGLHRTGVDRNNYFRLNVEVGIGDLGMNEWSRLAEISTCTRAYLGRADVQSMNQGVAEKLADVWRKVHEGSNFDSGILNRELPALPPDAQYDSEPDEEIARHMKELESISMRCGL